MDGNGQCTPLSWLYIIPDANGHQVGHWVSERWIWGGNDTMSMAGWVSSEVISAEVELLLLLIIIHCSAVSLSRRFLPPKPASMKLFQPRHENNLWRCLWFTISFFSKAGQTFSWGSVHPNRTYPHLLWSTSINIFNTLDPPALTLLSLIK